MCWKRCCPWLYSTEELVIKRCKKWREKTHPPIHRTNYQWAIEHFFSAFQHAPEDSSGSQLTDAEEKLSDSLTAHTESVRERERDTGREREITKCSHVYPLSEDPLLPAHSLSSLALSSSAYTPTLPLLSQICRSLPAAVLTSCRYGGCEHQCQQHSERLMLKKTAPIRAFASSLQGPLRPTEPGRTNSACINNSVTSFSSGSHWGDGLNGQALGALVCGRGWGRGCLQLQQLALCVKWSWKTTMECWVQEWNPEQRGSNLHKGLCGFQNTWQIWTSVHMHEGGMSIHNFNSTTGYL